MPPPLTIKDGEVGVDERHSTMDSHVPPPPPRLIVKDGEVGVDEGHSTMDSHVSPSPPDSKRRGGGCG